MRHGPPDPEWAPAFHSPVLSERSYGPEVAAFAEKFMFASKGMRAGQSLDFTDWQRWALTHALQRKPDGRLQYRQFVLGMPRKTAKSLMGASIALYFMAGNPQLGREIYSIAGDRMQARLVFGEAREQVIRNPYLASALKVTRDSLYDPPTGSVYRVLSHDGKLAQGLNPFLTIADEAHIFPTSQTQPGTSELYEAMLQGSGARDESLLLTITTAGDYRDDALLTRLFDYGKKIAAGEIEDDSFGFAWWQAPDGCDIYDEKNWHVANPNLRLGLADIEEMRATAKSSPAASFSRYRLNMHVPLGGIQWMNMSLWNDAARPELDLKPNDEIVLGFDGSVSRDGTALVAQRVSDGLLKVLGYWENPDPEGLPDWQVPRDEVDEAVADAFDVYRVKMMQMDVAYWTAEFGDWQQKYGVKKVLDFSMSNSRMVPAVQEFYAGIATGEICHTGEPLLTRHISNCVAHETIRGITVKKQSKDSRHRIDAAVAATICNDTRLRLPRRSGWSGGF